uniref:polynucleotide adenylyltransferase n=1 Tax=Meloidogyne hapla TaxID=6305 RepID=A0A1I8B1A3_MELHA
MNELTNWNGKECKNKQNIDKAIKQQRDDLTDLHTKFLEGNITEYKNKIKKNPGTLTKMLQLIRTDKLDFLKLEYLIFDDEYFEKYFINSINSELFLKTVIANRIALKMIVWARWMNELIKEKEQSNSGLSRSQLKEIWRKRQIMLISKIDENFAELTEFVLDQLDLFIEVSTQDVEKEWKDLESGKKQKIEKNSEKYEQFIYWINGKCLEFFEKIFFNSKELNDNIINQLTNNNLTKVYLLKIVGFNGIKEIFTKIKLPIKYEEFGITKEKIEEIIKKEKNNYIDPNNRRKIEKIEIEEINEEIENKKNKKEKKHLNKQKEKNDEKQNEERKSKKQFKREKRLKNEKVKEKYILDFMEDTIKDEKQLNNESNDTINEIILKEKSKISLFDSFLIKLKNLLIEAKCQDFEAYELKIKEIEKNLILARYIIIFENNEERRWSNKIRLIWEDKKEEILKNNEIDCNLLEKELIKILENILEEIKERLLIRELREREQKNLKWNAHKKALNDFGLFIYNWIPYSHQDNKQIKNIAKFVMSGSHRLGTATTSSDIDGIILVPKKSYWDSQFDLDFFGEFDCIEKKCVNNLKEGVSFIYLMKEMEGDNSLFCKLCEHPSVENLRRIDGRVPLIGLKFGGFDFDLLFVTLEENIINKYFNEGNSLTLTEMDEVINEFIKGIRNIDDLSEKRKGMLFALSGLRANLRVIELLEENFYKFRIIYVTLKLWTKEHFIYGGQFGFLSSSSLTVIICKIILENPKLSTTLLIKQLFEYLINWINFSLNEEKIIILEEPKLNKINEELIKEKGEEFKNKLNEEENKKLIKESIWPIISPGFPIQNVGFNVNKSTEIIIKKEIKKGIDKLNKLQEEFKELINYENDEENLKIFSGKIWKDWLDGDKFQEKYDNYLAIICSHTTKSNYGPLFCDYSGTRIRQALLLRIEEPNSDIEYCHATKYLNSQPCPKDFKEILNKEELLLCNVWLIGIKGNIENDKIKIFFETNLEYFSEDILDSFDKTKEVKKKKADRETYNLNIIFLTKDELMKWNYLN